MLHPEIALLLVKDHINNMFAEADRERRAQFVRARARRDALALEAQPVRRPDSLKEFRPAPAALAPGVGSANTVGEGSSEQPALSDQPTFGMMVPVAEGMAVVTAAGEAFLLDADAARPSVRLDSLLPRTEG
jgi:hypothetical protein